MHRANPLRATDAAAPPVRRIARSDVEAMPPHHVESVVNVRSNMAELLRQRGSYEDAANMLRSALDTAIIALEVHHRGGWGAAGGGGGPSSGTNATTTIDAAPCPTAEEWGNAVVDLMVKVADNLLSADDCDGAAEAYERALASHVHLRRRRGPIDEDGGGGDGGDVGPTFAAATSNASTQSLLPAATTRVAFDLEAATAMESAIRNNLAHALARIGQDKLSLEHYECALAIKRDAGGDVHVEVAHTLMAMGALLGGPMGDFGRALNCFKEALHIYRINFEELTGGAMDDDGDEGHGRRSGFFDGEEAEEIDRHIRNAVKNISLIEAALLKDRDGVSKRRRR